MSILRKIILFYIFIFLILAGGVYYTLHYYSQKTDKQTYTQIQNNLKALINERIEVKKQFGITNAISIANDTRLAQALENNDRDLAIKILLDVSNKLEQYPISKKTKIHIHTNKNFSFVRHWKLDKYGDDLNSFRNTVVSVNKNHENINSFEVGRLGLVLRSIVNIQNQDKKYVGSLELIHSIDSIVEQFDKHNDGFLLLMHDKLSVKEFKKADKLFNYDISQKLVQKDFLADARSIEMDSLLKNHYFIGKSYYFTYEKVKDFKGEELGIYLIGRNLAQVQETVESKKELINKAFVAALFILVIMIIISNIGLNVLILSPLQKIDKGILSFFNFLQRKSFQVDKIDIKTNDEFGTIANSINENIKVSKQLHEEIYELNSSLESKIEERTKELEKQKETFAAIYNGSKDAIAILDMESNFLQVNHAYTEMTGLSEEELLNTSCLALTQDEYIESSKEVMQRVIDTGYVKNYEKHCKVKDGTYITVNMSISLLQNPQRLLISVRDVSALKEIENAKSQFLSNMSHEIRTPLNAILGFVNILKKRVKEKESLGYLNIIDSSGNSLLTIINDILDFSKIQSGNFTIEKYNIECIEEFNEIVMLFSSKAKEKNINYNVIIGENIPKTIKIDAVRVKQIFANLLSNAIKFTPDNGTINVSLNYEEPNIIASVEDSGIGISKENQEKIFLAFKQADNSTTREFGGTGLGLSISSSLAKLMDGELSVQSEVGKGTTFTLNFPVEVIENQLSELDENLSEDAQEIQFRGHILIAEDNRTNQMLIKIILSDYGLSYEIANDGLEAIALFEKSRFDLVLMDENMPNLNGIEAMKQIKMYEKENSLTPTPIIALTANALDSDRERFLEEGMDGFIAKPIDTEALEEELKKYLQTL